MNEIALKPLATICDKIGYSLISGENLNTLILFDIQDTIFAPVDELDEILYDD